MINSVTTTATDSSIKIDVSAIKGSNTISKYYYSIDSGNTYVESTSNSYTFTGLKSGINYRIIVKVIDSNNKYSNIYVVNEKIATSTSNLIKFKFFGTEYYAEKGMTFSEWTESDYNTFGYFYDDYYKPWTIEDNGEYELEWVNSLYTNQNGITFSLLSEKNLKTIYSETNYNAIGRTFGAFERGYVDAESIQEYAKDLSIQQQNTLKSILSSYSDMECAVPAFYVSVDSSKVNKDASGFYDVNITVEVLKTDGELNSLILVFDGASKNFYVLDSDSIDNITGDTTFKVKGDFVFMGFLTSYDFDTEE